MSRVFEIIAHQNREKTNRSIGRISKSHTMILSQLIIVFNLCAIVTTVEFLNLS